MNLKVKKRGLSPVIATVLLISLALVLALIIFFWAKNFIGEKIQKNGEAIELSCQKVSFRADAYFVDSNLVVDILNSGSIPLYGAELKGKNAALGSIKRIGGVFTSTISGGRTGTITTDRGGLNTRDTLVVSPMLLGSQGEVNKPFTCLDSSIDVMIR